MNRVLETEWLDELPPDDRNAQRSRLDLRRLNWILGHARPMARALAPGLEIQDSPRVADLGAGDGTFALRLARRLPRPRCGGEFILVEKHNLRSTALVSAFAGLGWELRFVEADAFEWLESAAAGRLDALLANLFLHHFQEACLGRLFAGIAAHSACFVACETRRSSVGLAASRCVGLIGCRAVTHHDAIVSVRSGFRDSELTRLWPAGTAWRIEEHRLGWCSHWFMARRVQCPGN
jgi:hypothetical protein